MSRPIFLFPTATLRPNRWDLLAVPAVLGLVALLAWGSHQMAVPFTPGEEATLSLDPIHLPEYALRSVLRMAFALVLSLVFTFTYAALAAKNRRAEAVLIPVLDILQSVPILGFLSVTVVGFMALFPGNLLGLELAAIFAIFTSQAWNMTFAFYQALKTVPPDMTEAAAIYHLSPWKRFWKVETPFAMPGLVWNTMMSVSGGWFFVVAAEAIAVGARQVALPGIGSYVALAIEQANLAAIGWAVLTMLIVILLYDQLAFRPLVAWSEKFKLGDTAATYTAQSWVLDLLRRTRLLRRLIALPGEAWATLSERLPAPSRVPAHHPSLGALRRVLTVIIGATLIALALAGFWTLVSFIARRETAGEVLEAFGLGFLTFVRVLVLVLIAALVWTPVGVYVGLNPRLAVRVQPLAQFLAAFPANLLFPAVVIVIIHFNLSPEIWTAPLMILGTQWYILFNVIAGAAAIPNDLRDAARTFDLSHLQRWRRLYLPGILPYLATGLITAAGGTWNASIVAEVVSWGQDTLTATGLGAYIAEATAREDFGAIVLGITVMSIYVVGLNALLWRRLYRFAEQRFRLD